jgi:ArsR family transcriptional regulator, arsenate/arsenite/antimonite-responsive transcriptional repressor
MTIDQYISDTCLLKPLLDGIRDPIRMEIVFVLAEYPFLNVTDIAGRFKVSRPAISHHLKVLKDAGVLQCSRNGQEMIYSLNRRMVVDGLRQIANNLEICCAGTGKDPD